MCVLAFVTKCQSEGLNVAIYIKDQQCNVAPKTSELMHCSV